MVTRVATALVPVIAIALATTSARADKGKSGPDKTANIDTTTTIGVGKPLTDTQSRPNNDKQPWDKPTKPKLRINMSPGTPAPSAHTERVLKARRGIWVRCYERELLRNPGLRGRVTLDVNVAANGSVSSVKMKQTLGSDAVGTCIAAQVKRLELRPTAVATRFSYQMVFVTDQP